MNIPAGVIFIWTGNNAAIPAGWQRVTALDGRFPKGTADGVDPNVTGGNSTHTHTSSAHTHTENSHTHTISISNGINNTNKNSDAGSGLTSNHHNHGGTFQSGAISDFSCESIAVTYSSVSNNPPYYEVIFITPISDTTILPTGVISLADDDSITGFNICDGNNSTPNLIGKYLRGAATSGDAGATGGSNTNVHSISHTHTTSHTHSEATSGGSSMNGRTSKTNIAQAYHTHSVTPNSATPSLGGSIDLTTTETVEPAYTKLLALYNSSASTISPGIIGLWIGNLSNIPAGWVLCDGSNETIDMRDRHLKITGTLGEVGYANGSNTHTHSSQSHTHSAVSHNHSVNNLGHGGGSSYAGGGQVNDDNTTYHTVSTSNSNLVTNSSSTSADSSNNEPLFLTVAFIRLNGEEFTQEVSDTMSVSASMTKHPNKVVTDFPEITDIYSRRGDFIRELLDTPSLEDTFSYFFLLYKQLHEHISIAENIAKAMARELLGGVSIASSALKKPEKMFEEALSLAENITSAVFKLRILVESIKIKASIRKKTSRVFSLSLTVADSIKKKFKKILAYTLTITEDYVNIATIRDKMIHARIFGNNSKNARISSGTSNNPKIDYNKNNKPNIR